MSLFTIDNKVEQFPNTGNSVGIDKITFDYPYSVEIEERLGLRNKLMNVEEHTGVIKYSRGELDNGINVTINTNSIRVKLNPAVEIFDNNFFTVTKQNLREYLKSKLTSLGLDIDLAILRRLDIQSTIKVRYSPKEYFSVLGSYNSYTRNKVSTSLYYSSNSKSKYKSMIFYDKTEQKRKDTPIEFLDGNYLRYESQYYNKYLKQIAKKFDKNNLTIMDLFNDKVYDKLIGCWYNDFKSIYKENQLAFNLNNISRPSDIDVQLAALGLEALGGVRKVCDIVDSAKIFSNKTASFISKMKFRVKALGKHKNVVQHTSLLQELESLVLEAYKGVVNF